MDTALALLDSSFNTSEDGEAEIADADEPVTAPSKDVCGPRTLGPDTGDLESEYGEGIGRGTGDRDEDEPSSSEEEIGESGNSSCSEPGSDHESSGAAKETNSEPGLDESREGDRRQSLTPGVGSDPETDHETEESDGYEQTPKKRKRLRQPLKWKKNRRVRLRNSGKPYASTSGRQVRVEGCFIVH